MLEIKDIVKNELCTGCGLCISESVDGFMEWDDYGFLVPNIDSTYNEKAIKLCPFNPQPDEEVKDEDKLANLFLNETTNKDVKVGKYINTYVGHSNSFRESASSGGIATYVFEELLKRKVVDHIYVVNEMNGTYAYQLFSDIASIKRTSKTKYIPVTLSELFKNIDKLEGKVALSGVACFIKAVRLKQFYNPTLKEKIPFLIGIICGGLKSKFFTDYLAQVAGIEGEYSKQDYRLKDKNSTASDYSFGAFDKENVFHQTKMSIVGDMWGTGLFKSNACDFCTDVTTELADISLGDAWLAPYKYDGLGTSVIVTRSALADKMICDGIELRHLSVSELDFSEFLLSQKGSFNHRHNGLKYRVDLCERQNSLLPYVRKRFLVKTSFEFKLVQKRRRVLRERSLLLWKEYPNKKDFETRVAFLKDDLAKYTTLYHRIGRLKKMLGLK